jgi:GTPase SAR1 family protein
VRWFEDASTFGGSDLRFTLIANKIDMDNKRVVLTKEGHDFATAHNMEFLEVSAKQSINIEEIFEVTARNILDGINRGTIDINNEVRCKMTKSSLNCCDGCT